MKMKNFQIRKLYFSWKNTKPKYNVESYAICTICSWWNRMDKNSWNGISTDSAVGQQRGFSWLIYQLSEIDWKKESETELYGIFREFENCDIIYLWNTTCICFRIHKGFFIAIIIQRESIYVCILYIDTNRVNFSSLLFLV